MYVYIYVYIYNYIYIRIYIYIYVYIYIYTCIYIYTHMYTVNEVQRQGSRPLHFVLEAEKCLVPKGRQSGQIPAQIEYGTCRKGCLCMNEP